MPTFLGLAWVIKMDYDDDDDEKVWRSAYAYRKAFVGLQLLHSLSEEREGRLQGKIRLDF